MRTRRVELADVTLEIAEAGAGQRPLLLVHGFGGAKEDFTHVLDDLAARGWHAVAPDLRGHGASDRTEDESRYSLERFAADLVELAGALGWRRCTMLGHSMGGMAVQHVVLDRPDIVEALVLMDTTHGPMDWLDPDVVAMGVEIIRKEGVDAYVDLANVLRDADPLVTPANRRLLEEQEGYAEFSDRKARATAAAMRTAMMTTFASQPGRLDALAATVRVPTLVLVGEQDEGFVDHCRALADAIPGARLVIVPDAGHSPQFENPDAWWAALAGFLDEVARAAA